MSNTTIPPVEDAKEPLWPYYVYILLNPLKDNKVFYVGKGTGQRAGAHERDVDRLINDEKRKRKLQEQNEKLFPAENDVLHPMLNEEELSHKEREILELKNANISPLQLIVGRHETEDEAFAVEAVLIHFMFGYENLTNTASGHGYKFLRTREEYEAILANAKIQSDIPARKGIDVEKKSMRNNEYRDEKVMGLQQARAFDFLSELQDALTANNFNWRNFTEQGDKYFHPGVSNGYLAVIVRIGTVDFNIQFTKRLVFSLQFIYTPDRPHTREQAELRALERLPQDIRDRLQISLGEPKAGNKYSWVLPQQRFQFDSIVSLIAALTELKSVIEPEHP